MTHKTSASWKKLSDSISQSIPFSPDDVLSVVVNAPFSISGHAGQHVFVKGVGALNWRREAAQVLLELNGFGSVRIPRNAHIRLKADGPLKIRDVAAARINIQESAGPLSIQDGGSLQIHAADGPVHCRAIHNGVRIGTVDGPTYLENIGGDIVIEQADGPVVIKNPGGDVTLACKGAAALYLPETLPQKVQLRVDGDVHLIVPASARIEGTLQAAKEIHVELAQHMAQEKATTIRLIPPDTSSPTILVDIVAQGRIYVGPHPPKLPHSGFHWMGLAGLFSRRWRKKKSSRHQAASPRPTTKNTTFASANKDRSAEREMILRMVAEGKLTADEGHQLLEALE